MKLIGRMILLAGALAGYWFGLRRKLLGWGTSEAEQASAMPGDEIVEQPDLISTRGITILAGADKVWALLERLGLGRSGFYSYSWLDRGTSPQEQAERLAVGEAVWLNGEDDGEEGLWLQVERCEAPHNLLLLSSEPVKAAFERKRPWGSWSFQLRELDDGLVRLITRFRLVHKQDFANHLRLRLLELVLYAVERKMLETLKQRAEAAPLS